MPAVRVEVGYLTSPEDRPRLVDAGFRDRVAEAIIAAVQRIYEPAESAEDSFEADIARGVDAAGETLVPA
jgi:N-acetylmuramoyl-L-alanine amidase